jgi:thioredoxin-related protein
MKNYLNKFFPIVVVILLIAIQNKQNYYKIENKKENQNINISETYLSLEEAKVASKELKKDILIIFETEWCGTCRKFKESVFDTKELEKYIVCFLDIDKEKELADSYIVKSLPYYVIVNSDGIVKKRGSGYKSKIIFLNWLNNKTFKNNFSTRSHINGK